MADRYPPLIIQAGLICRLIPVTGFARSERARLKALPAPIEDEPEGCGTKAVTTRSSFSRKHALPSKPNAVMHRPSASCCGSTGIAFRKAIRVADYAGWNSFVTATSRTASLPHGSQLIENQSLRSSCMTGTPFVVQCQQVVQLLERNSYYFDESLTVGIGDKD